jgi:hypothetical protein
MEIAEMTPMIPSITSSSSSVNPRLDCMPWEQQGEGQRGGRPVTY